MEMSVHVLGIMIHHGQRRLRAEDIDDGVCHLMTWEGQFRTVNASLLIPFKFIHRIINKVPVLSTIYTLLFCLCRCYP